MTRLIAAGPARDHAAHVWQPDGFTACGRYAVPAPWTFVTGRCWRLCRKCKA